MVDGKLTDEFPVTTGVLQGDTLAPLLFIIVIDYVMKNAVLDSAAEHNAHGFCTNLREGTRHRENKPATYVYDLDFADDIALMENSRETCQSQLSITSKRANEVGLQINYKKTEIMTNQPKDNNNKITVDGNDIEFVDNFKYLGSMMLSSESDFKARRGQAWSAFEKMKSIWRSKVVPIQLKAKIFRASCLSILMYGSESWIITKQFGKMINSFATTAYRLMLGIKRSDRVSNDHIYKMTGQIPLVVQIQQRQLRFIGHSLRRAPNDLITKYALYTPKAGHGHRKRGRPKTSYIEYIAKIINDVTPPTEQEIRMMATDRAGWSKIVKIVVDRKSSRYAAE
jgi:hypothetical protein